ncbi:hypothetical protein KY285_008117 [Solanum tuberosum]|nr:hypothetical protein KY285_008117 [Solanum tuberosum]
MELGEETLLKGSSFPVKVLITQRSDPLDNSTMRSPDNHGSLRDSEMGPSQQADGSFEDELQSRSNLNASSSASQAKSSRQIQNTHPTKYRSHQLAQELLIHLG